MSKNKIILNIFIVALIFSPCTCLSACPEGNFCLWILNETYNSRTVEVSNPVDVCGFINQGLHSLPSCNNYTIGSIFTLLTNVQEIITSNSNSGHCSYTVNKYINVCKPIPTCYDWIQNQGEEGIDCGGPCQCCSFATYYLDSDGDGYGGSSGQIQGCSAPAGYASTATDCKDDDSAVYPGQAEICGDGKDNDCNGSRDCLDSACFWTPACSTSNVKGGLCSEL